MVFNTIEPALLGHKVLELAADRKNMVLGFATAAGLLVALLSQPVVGALSDRVRSRWGRRLPILFIGTLLVVVALPLTALSPSLAALIPALLMVYLATNIAQAPTQALIPDLVPERQRGIAAGFKATYDILGLVLGRWISGELVALGRVMAGIRKLRPVMPLLEALGGILVIFIGGLFYFRHMEYEFADVV